MPADPLLTSALPIDGPWDWSAALALLVAHTIPGAETTEALPDGPGGVHRRLLRVDDELVLVSLELSADGLAVTAPAEVHDEVSRRVRLWFELDVDQLARNQRFAADPMIGPLVSRRPGLRVTGHPDPFEALLAIVVGQQISLAAARTVTGRLVSTYGTPGPGGLTAFPRPEDLAGLTVEELRASCGFMESRARTLLTVAQAAADGLSMTPRQGADELRETRARLLALRGIGPWTVDFWCLRALGSPDEFPAGDLVLKRVLGVTTDRAARDAALRWRPERSFAALHLWTDAAYLA